MNKNLIKLCIISVAAAMLASGCSIWKRTPVKPAPVTSTRVAPTVIPAAATVTEPAGAPTGLQIAPTTTSTTTTTPSAGVVQTADQGTIELRKEELVVGKKQVSNGGVLLRTTVQAEEVSKPVDVMREQYVIEHIPAAEAAAWATNTAIVFQGQEIYIPLVREEPVATKRTLLSEKVQIGKRVENDAVTVNHPVRSESVEVVETPAPAESGPINLSQTPVAAQTANVISDNVQLAREEIIVGKRQQENGAVRLRKVVTTQNASQPMDLKREEYTVMRTPLGDQPIQDANFNPRQVKLDLIREEPVVGTQNRLTEVVRVRKQVVTDKKVVTGTVLKEGFELVKTPTTGQSVTIAPAAYTPASTNTVSPR